MPHEARRSQFPQHARAFTRAIAYDLGRTARQVADGAGVVLDAVRDVSGARAETPRHGSDVVHEPRVELAFDPRARARGRYMPATLALKVRRGEVDHVAWSSSAASMHELGSHMRRYLEALDGSVRMPVFADGPIRQQDVLDLLDVSGMTRALSDVRRRALRYDRHPTLALLLDRLEALGPEGRRALVERFAARIEAAPALDRIVGASGFRPVAVRPQDVEALLPVIAASAREGFAELGLDDRDVADLAAIARDVGRPLTELAELYLAPRTLGQHMKRTWRVHRITLLALQQAARG